MTGGTTRTRVAVVGGGPVGLTTSVLLSRLGVEHVLLERHPGTSIHPKAIGLNQRTIEVFRHLGIEDEVRAHAAPPETVGRTGWYTSFAGPTPLHGRRIAVRDAWGGGAYREEYAAASPSGYAMLPQIRLEPLLRRAAEAHPQADVRFGCTVTGLSDPHGDTVDVSFETADGATGTVTADYVVAADGGRTVGGLLGIGDTGPTNLLDMVSAHFSADLTPHLVDDGNLIHWFVNPDHAGSIGSGYLYHLGPWDEQGRSEEWVFACAFLPTDPARFDDADMRARINRSLGLPDLEVELHSVSHWYIRSVVADRFRAGRVFLVGDAAHRIPPWGALGLNTGVQDAHNLAWKLAAALADPALAPLLHSYETERRPVALTVAANSLANFQNHGGVVDVALGLDPAAPPAEGWAALERLFSDGPEGEAARASVDAAMAVLDKEFHAHGAELGFYYSAGAVLREEGSPGDCVPDDLLVHRPTSAPGHHLPHAWVETADGRRSTLDLVRPGRWLLVVDEAADAWRAAVAGGSALAGFVDVVDVGPGVERTVRSDAAWTAAREVGPGGALLVRPDTIVAWRSADLPADPAAVLADVLDRLTAAPEPAPAGG
ncbi:FAD-dependent monooxygenase [Geodermatophilus sp. SYSU D00815]